MCGRFLFVIAAIVAECNPPHSGHAYLISRIREEFGTDTCVLLLLSGNYVQRGDLAFTDRYSRAAGAVAIGADLVLELPFPYSCQTAEIYATSSVSILNRLVYASGVSQVTCTDCRQSPTIFRLMPMRPILKRQGRQISGRASRRSGPTSYAKKYRQMPQMRLICLIISLQSSILWH